MYCSAYSGGVPPYFNFSLTVTVQLTTFIKNENFVSEEVML